jgi:hypothetical protein
MPLDPEILGSTVNISGQQSAEDALAVKAAEAEAQRQDSASSAFDYGPKLTFGTSGGGTPYQADRYSGEASIPYSPGTSGMSQENWQKIEDQERENRRTGSVAASAANATPDLGPYQQARQNVDNFTADLRDTYTRQGRFGAIGGKDFQQDLGGILSGAGYGSPPPEPPPPSPYQDARRQADQITNSLRDRYASEGNFAGVGGEKYNADLASGLFGAGLGPEPEAPSPYQEASRRADAITSDLRDKYASEGRFGDIGGKEFKEELLSAKVNDGLASAPKQEAPESFGARIRSGMKGQGGYALAYGLQSIAEGASRAYAVDNDGMSHTGAQVDQAATGVLPGTLTVAGAIVGAGFGNPILGAGIAGGIGSIAQSVLGSRLGIEDSQERAGDSLSIGRGGAEAADEFAKTLAGVLTPAAKELAEAFQKLGQSGPVSASGAAGLAPFQYDFGTAFSQTVDTEDRFLSGSPFLAGMRQRFGTGQGAIAVPETDYLGAAGIAASTGDYGAMMSNLGFAQAKAGRDQVNPSWQRDKDFVDRYSKNAGAWQDTKDFFTLDGGQEAAYESAQQRLGNVGAGGTYVPGSGTESQYLSRQNKSEADRIAKEAQDYQNQYETFQKDQSVITGSGSSLGADTARLKLLTMTGGGAAAMRAAQGGLDADARGGADAVEVDISTLAGYRDKYPQFKSYYDSMIASDREKEAQFESVPTENRVAAFRTGLGEEDARFSLSVTRARIEGGSAGDIYARTRAQSRYLQGIDEDPSSPLSPTERAGIEQGRLQSVYQAQQDVYSQNLEGNTLRSQVALERVDKAQRDGGPQEVFQAGQAVVESYTARVKELTDELNKGGLTFDDRIQKEKQLSDARRQSSSYDDANHERLYDDNGTVFSTQRESDSVGLSRRIGRGGNAAFDRSILSDDLNAETNAQSRLDYDRRAHPGNPQRIAGDTLALRQSQDAREDDLDAANTYRPTGAQSRQLANDEAAFSRSKIAPYTDAGGDPFSRGQSLENDYRQRLGELDRNRAGVIRAGNWRDEDESRYTDQRNDLLGRESELEHDRLEAAYGALPEMVAGSVRGGTGAALVTPRAISALYSPNAENGSWAGVPAGGHPVGGVASVSPYGKGIDPSGLIPMTGGSAGMSETNRLLGVLITTVQQQARGGGRVGGPQAPYDPVGPANRALIFGLNPNTGR